MSRSNTFVLRFGIALGAVLIGGAAEAAIKPVSCAALVKFGQEIDARQVVPVGQGQGRLALPAAYMSPRAEQLFGQPTLDWTPDDVAAAIKMAGDCSNEAKRAKRRDDIQALTAVWQSLAQVRSTLGSIAATNQKIDQRLKALLEAQPSRPTLVSLVVVATAARDGSADALQKGDKALRDHSVQINAWHPVHSQAQAILGLLADAPAKSRQMLVPAVEKRTAEVRQWVVDDVKASIDATPESPDGLKALGNSVAKTKAELAAWLPSSDLASFDSMAEARRNAIEDALLAKEMARIDAAPPNADGLNRLRMAQAGPVKAALSPARVASLDKRMAARHDEIGKAVTDEQIKRLDQFPATMAGLRDLDAFRSNTSNGLQALAGPDFAARFQEAAVKRASKIGEESFGPFRKAIADIPENEQGLATFDAALAEIRGPIGTLDANVRSRYLEAATKRREAIVAAIAKEDARLAKLPLVGAVFADKDAGAKLEFRNKTRVYITVLQDQTAEGEYEVDGDKVIIRTPRSNDVFKRDGAWLRGAMLNLKRQPEK